MGLLMPYAAVLYLPFAGVLEGVPHSGVSGDNRGR